MIPADVGPIVNRIASEFWSAVGEAKTRWTQSDIDLCEACFIDAAKVYVLAAGDPERARAVKKQVDAQLKNIKVAGSEAVAHTASDVLWRVIATILEIGVPILVKSVI